jgi:hypothetical protein
MTKRTFLTFLIVSICYYASAQPGYRVEDLSDVYQTTYEAYPKEIRHIKIDAKSPLANLKYLSKLHYIYIHLYLKTLPKEIGLLADSLQNILIDCNDSVNDLSALNELKNLRSIKIMNYGGTSLPNLMALNSLESFSYFKYYGADKLKSIAGLKHCKKLMSLHLISGSLEKFDLEMSQMNLVSLELENCPLLKNIDGITTSKTLNRLWLFDIGISELPANMKQMSSLRYLDILYLRNLADLSNLKHMKNLRNVHINGAFVLTDIPNAFSTNTKLDTIDIEYCRKLRSAEGIVNLKYLRLLSMEDLNKDFTIPAQINSCNNLEELKMDININTDKQKDISMIKNLLKLKKLYIGRARFFTIPTELYTNTNVEDLTIYANGIVTDLSGVTRFHNLKKLEIMFNDKLTKIPDADKLLYIKDLEVHNNASLTLSDSYSNTNKTWVIHDNAR